MHMSSSILSSTHSEVLLGKVHVGNADLAYLKTAAFSAESMHCNVMWTNNWWVMIIKYVLLLAAQSAFHTYFLSNISKTLCWYKCILGWFPQNKVQIIISKYNLIHLIFNKVFYNTNLECSKMYVSYIHCFNHRWPKEQQFILMVLKFIKSSFLSINSKFILYYTTLTYTHTVHVEIFMLTFLSFNKYNPHLPGLPY